MDGAEGSVGKFTGKLTGPEPLQLTADVITEYTVNAFNPVSWMLMGVEAMLFDVNVKQEQPAAEQSVHPDGDTTST